MTLQSIARAFSVHLRIVFTTDSKGTDALGHQDAECRCDREIRIFFPRNPVDAKDHRGIWQQRAELGHDGPLRGRHRLGIRSVDRYVARRDSRSTLAAAV